MVQTYVDKISFLQGDSATTIPNIVKEEKKWTFDYALVDGNHEKSASAADLRNVVSIIERGGFLLFDDITIDGCSLQDVWDAFKVEFKDQFVFNENHEGKGIGVGIKL